MHVGSTNSIGSWKYIPGDSSELHNIFNDAMWAGSSIRQWIQFYSSYCGGGLIYKIVSRESIELSDGL